MGQSLSECKQAIAQLDHLGRGLSITYRHVASGTSRTIDLKVKEELSGASGQTFRIDRCVQGDCECRLSSLDGQTTQIFNRFRGNECFHVQNAEYMEDPIDRYFIWLETKSGYYNLGSFELLINCFYDRQNLTSILKTGRSRVHNGPKGDSVVSVQYDQGSLEITLNEPSLLPRQVLIKKKAGMIAPRGTLLKRDCSVGYLDIEYGEKNEQRYIDSWTVSVEQNDGYDWQSWKAESVDQCLSLPTKFIVPEFEIVDGARVSVLEDGVASKLLYQYHEGEVVKVVDSDVENAVQDVSFATDRKPILHYEVVLLVVIALVILVALVWMRRQ